MTRRRRQFLCLAHPCRVPSQPAGAPCTRRRPWGRHLWCRNIPVRCFAAIVKRCALTRVFGSAGIYRERVRDGGACDRSGRIGRNNRRRPVLFEVALAQPPNSAATTSNGRICLCITFAILAVRGWRVSPPSGTISTMARGVLQMYSMAVCDPDVSTERRRARKLRSIPAIDRRHGVAGFTDVPGYSRAAG